MKHKVEIMEVINFNDIDWTRKEFKKLFKKNDLIYVKKLSMETIV